MSKPHMLTKATCDSGWRTSVRKEKERMARPPTTAAEEGGKELPKHDVLSKATSDRRRSHTRGSENSYESRPPTTAAREGGIALSKHHVQTKATSDSGRRTATTRKGAIMAMRLCHRQQPLGEKSPGHIL